MASSAASTAEAEREAPRHREDQTMAKRDVPRNQWRETLDSFSRQHEGWVVHVDVTDADGRTRAEADDLPLQGISTDSGRNDRIDVMVGQQRDDHITHEIVDPVNVAIEQADGGADHALRIRSRDGSTTIVEFRSPRTEESTR
jgi:hypothetical protein